MSIPFSASAQESSFFTPTMISSLALWFDASDPATITQSGGLVSEWRDKSSNAYSVIQGTVGNRPTYATNLLNGLPGVQLSVTTYLYQVGSSMPNFSSSPATTVYMVAKNGSSMPNWNIINTMWFTGISGATQRYHFSFGYLTTNGITLFAKGAAVVNPSSYVVPLNSNAIIGFSSSATSNFIFYNGSNTAYASSGALPSANNTTWFLFGDARTSTPPVTDENIYEYVGFNTVLTTAQQQLVEGYLATKWGLQSSLSNGHPYKTTPLYTIPSLMTPATYPTSVINNPQFDPRLIPGCILWLDGADPNGTGTPPANGATLTTWKDKSISNFPFTSVGSAYSTSAVNGRPGINIGTNFFGYDPGSAQNNWQEVFALGLWTGGSTFDTFNGLVTSSKTSDGGIQGGILFIGNAASSNWWPPGNTYVTQFVNGVQTNVAFPAIQTPFITRTHSVTAVNLQGLRFGIDREITDRKWIGFISEVICYNTALSSTQRQQVEAYLAQKWKVSSLSSQNIYAPGSYLTFVNAPSVPIPPRRAAQSNKFLPSQYSNCVLWLDAADPLNTGRQPAAGTLTTWVDKSGNNNSTTGSTGTPQWSPVGANSRPAVTFNGTSGQFSIPLVVSQDWSVFIIIATTQSPASSGGQWWAGNGIFDAEVGGTANDFGMSLYGSKFAVGIGNNDTTIFSTSDINTGAFFLCESLRTQSTGAISILINGLQQASGTGATAQRNTSRITIGSIQTNGGYLGGSISEIVCYTRVLSTVERQQVEGYFAWKWGLKSQLGPGHPFFFIPPLPIS